MVGRIGVIAVAAGLLCGGTAAFPAGVRAGAESGPLPAKVAALEVTAEHRAGYERDAFGDYDRDAILERNLDAFPGCEGYRSRYDGVCYPLADYGGDPERADDEVDIDHVVALGEAWDSGAHAWPKRRRDRFSGDPRNLTVMTADLNRAKGDADIAGWTPPHAPSTCEYTRVYVEVKTAYDLSVDIAEKRALTELAQRCRGRDGQGGAAPGAGAGQESAEQSDPLADGGDDGIPLPDVPLWFVGLLVTAATAAIVGIRKLFGG